ncbi:MAG: helix-turn-helix domain-containing protein [Pseudomonadota bacterium]|nr:helix-turn-helix domain-containing protein [Pseudomonadota bacterium]
MELAYVQHAHVHAGDGDTSLHDVDGKALSLPGRANPGSTDAPPVSAAELLHRGHVMLDSALLRDLRQARLMSQQDLAEDCWRRNIQLSLTTIKRAETGRAVRFRVAREFARCFEVSVMRIVRTEETAVDCNH